jgi:hypothetical protein
VRLLFLAFDSLGGVGLSLVPDLYEKPGFYWSSLNYRCLGIYHVVVSAMEMAIWSSLPMIGTQLCCQYICRHTIETMAWWDLLILSLSSITWLIRYVLKPHAYQDWLVTYVKPLLSTWCVIHLCSFQNIQLESFTEYIQKTAGWSLLKEVKCMLYFTEST